MANITCSPAPPINQNFIPASMWFSEQMKWTERTVCFLSWFGFIKNKSRTPDITQWKHKAQGKAHMIQLLANVPYSPFKRGFVSEVNQSIWMHIQIYIINCCSLQEFRKIECSISGNCWLWFQWLNTGSMLFLLHLVRKNPKIRTSNITLLQIRCHQFNSATLLFPAIQHLTTRAFSFSFRTFRVV